VVRDPGVEDLDDVGVANGIGRARLVDETCECLLVVAKLAAQHLDGHLAADAGVFGKIHGPHSALSEQGGSAVVAEALANHSAAAYRLFRIRAAPVVGSGIRSG